MAKVVCFHSAALLTYVCVPPPPNSVQLISVCCAVRVRLRNTGSVQLEYSWRVVMEDGGRAVNFATELLSASPEGIAGHHCLPDPAPHPEPFRAHSLSRWLLQILPFQLGGWPTHTANCCCCLRRQIAGGTHLCLPTSLFCFSFPFLPELEEEEEEEEVWEEGEC